MKKMKYIIGLGLLIFGFLYDAFDYNLNQI